MWLRGDNYANFPHNYADAALICISTILTYTQHTLIAPSAPPELGTGANSTFCGGKFVLTSHFNAFQLICFLSFPTSSAHRSQRMKPFPVSKTNRSRMFDRWTANENAGSRWIGVPVALQCGSQNLDRRFGRGYLKTFRVRLIMTIWAKFGLVKLQQKVTMSNNPNAAKVLPDRDEIKKWN